MLIAFSIYMHCPINPLCYRYFKFRHFLVSTYIYSLCLTSFLEDQKCPLSVEGDPGAGPSV